MPAATGMSLLGFVRMLDAAADARGLRELISHHRAVGDVFEDLRHVAVDVAHTEGSVAHDLSIKTEDVLIGVGELRFWVDNVSANASQNEVTCDASRQHTFRYDSGQTGIEVVTTREAVVGRERARREIVRDTRVVAAVVAVDLGATVASHVKRRTDARCPVVLQRPVFNDRPAHRLLLVAKAWVDRETTSLPLVLDEEDEVGLEVSLVRY